MTPALLAGTGGARPDDPAGLHGARGGVLCFTGKNYANLTPSNIATLHGVCANADRSRAKWEAIRRDSEEFFIYTF
jgi:hypothetical protein